MKKWQEASKSIEVGAKRIVLWCLLLCFTQSDWCKKDSALVSSPVFHTIRFMQVRQIWRASCCPKRSVASSYPTFRPAQFVFHTIKSNTEKVSPIPRVQQSKSNTESRRFMLSHVSHVLYQMDPSCFLRKRTPYLFETLLSFGQLAWKKTPVNGSQHYPMQCETFFFMLYLPCLMVSFGLLRRGWPCLSARRLFCFRLCSRRCSLCFMQVRQIWRASCCPKRSVASSYPTCPAIQV